MTASKHAPATTVSGTVEEAGSGLDEAVVAGLVDPALLERAGVYARGARAASTWEAYDRDMARFVAWCTERGLSALPADR